MAEIKINVPDGYTMVKIDDSHYELQKIDNRSKSWEEYFSSRGISCGTPFSYATQICGSRTLDAFHKLICLYQEWIGDWKPNWNDNSVAKYTIKGYRNVIVVEHVFCYRRFFCFPTKEVAEEFLECFKDLFESAKDLI